MYQKARTSHTDVQIEISPKALSQKDAIPYNYVYCSEAQALAKEMAPDSNYTSSLMFGIQWDLVCKFLEVKSELTITDINSDSSSWGNYKNVARIITSEKAKQSTDYGNTWKLITGIKLSNRIILSSGSSEETKEMNIYDFAGNEWEWTLEHITSNSYYPCSDRGGCHGSLGADHPVSSRNGNDTTYSDEYVAFRPTLLDCQV